MILMVSSFAVAQTTTTVHNSDGSNTKVSVSCNRNGDCDVWDSTNDLTFKQLHKLNKDSEGFCKANHIKKNTPECREAYQADQEKQAEKN